jgi:sacsin
MESIQWTENDEKSISFAIKKVNFKQCSGIQTQLAMKSVEDGTISNERFIDNTNEQKCMHIEKNEDGTCIYFDTAEDNWNHTLTKCVTIFLNELVGKCFRDKFFVILMDIISMVKAPERIPLFLGKEKIEEYTLLSSDIETSPSFPIPGNIVPKKFHQYLDNGYGFIYEYDYKFIALEVDDLGLNLHDYGNSSEDDTEEINIDLELTYKFVHIIRMVGSRHELSLFQEYEVNYGSEETAIVRAYKLFKFIRKSKIKSGADTTVTLYKRSENLEEDESSLPSSLREAYTEIRRILREAWQKEQDERTGIVKRLYRNWHPDKNPDNVQFCTKVFQYIQQCLARLEKGLDLKDDDDDDGQFKSRSSTDHSYSGRTCGNTWYDRYWFRFRRSEYNSNSFDRNSNTRGTFRNFDDSWRHRETCYEPYHWYNRAKVWYRQAEYDLQNAMVSIEQLEDPQFNWVCYNAHQVRHNSMYICLYMLIKFQTHFK